MKRFLALFLAAALAAYPAHAGVLKAVSPSAGSFSGTLPIVNGGTGATTAGGALDNLTGATSTGGQWLNRTAAGAWTAQPEYQVLGTCNLLDYDPSFASKGEVAQGTSFQNWLLDCQQKAINLGAANASNNVMPACIKAQTMGLGTFEMKLNTPVVIPHFVCWDGSVTFTRDGSSGTPIANWNGDTTTKQLSNLYQPFFIMPPQTVMPGILRINANSTGTDRGTGGWYGRTWRMGSLAIQAGGSGFVGGETCTVANGDTSPAFGASFTCATASGGACTSITFSPTQWSTATGAYFLPPVLQRQQWAVSTNCNVNGVNNCWDGHDSKHPQVFDNDTNHYYKTSCSGAGTGLTVSAKFWPDWCSGAAADSDTISCAVGTAGPNGTNAYDGIFSNLVPATGYINQVYVNQSGQSFNSTYGYTTGFGIDAFELTANYIQTQLAHYGELLYGSDTVQLHHNDVGSAVQLKVRGGGSLHVIYAREDTPTDSINNDAHALEVDNCSNCYINGTFFHNTNSAADVGSPYLRIGSDTSISASNHESVNFRLLGQLYSGGSSGSNLAAMGLAYTRGLFDLHVSNIAASGSANAQQFTKFANFGSNVETGTTLRGTINNQADPIYSGTLPAGVAWQVVNGKTGALEFNCQAISQGGTGWTDTAIGTSEINLVSFPIPPMGANDKLEIDTLWDTTGSTATNTKNVIVRLGIAGCTPGSTCSSGSSVLSANLNSSSLVTLHTLTSVWNANATGSQVLFSSSNTNGFGNSSGAITTTSINTAGTPYINIDATTATASTDIIKLVAYSVKRCNGGS